MKKNTKKSTTKKLAKLAVKKSTIKKLMNTTAMKKRVVQNRNSFKKALYRANKMIASGNSFYQNKLSMKEFKREYTQFGKRTGMLNRKNLDKDLKTFLDNAISNKTPTQCASAAANLMKHLQNAVRSLNRSKGSITKLSNTNKKYIKVLKKASALKAEDKDGKTVYFIIKEKVPNKEDLLAVNDKYLNFKRIIIEYFGDKEYAEVYGS